MFIDHDSQYHHCSGQQYQSQYWCCKSASSYILLPSSLHFKPTELQIKIVNISIRKPNDHHHWLSVFQCRKYCWIQVGQSSSQTLGKVETVLTVQHVTMSRQITLEVTNSEPHTSHLTPHTWRTCKCPHERPGGCLLKLGKLDLFCQKLLSVSLYYLCFDTRHLKC